MTDKTERFLERATAGLATDPELRLDVQAELRAHIEDKTAELGGGDHADEAVASLGEVVELAEEVAQANQRRLGWRHLARRILRFGLVPASVCCALFLLYRNGLPPFVGNAPMMNWGTITETGWRSVDRWLLREPALTGSQRLLLHGDETQPNRADSFRPLWQSDPSNRAYYAEYVLQAMGTGPESNAQAGLRADLEQADGIDPDNAVYPLLAAILEARTAATIAADSLNVTSLQSMRVDDRNALDQAMPKLLAATGMPRYDTYRREIIEARFSALDPPTSLQDLIQRSWAIDSTILSDIPATWQAAHLSVAYARLLIDEGRPEKALPYLRLPEELARMIASNAFSISEFFLTCRLSELANHAALPMLREVGREKEAETTGERLSAITRLEDEWRRCIHDGESEGFQHTMKQHGGYFATALWNGCSITDTEALPNLLDTGRELEYTVATKVGLAFLGLVLLLTMLACLGVYLGWRMILGAQAAPLLLLPSCKDMLRFVLLGVALPFAVFLLWTHLPFSAHSQGILVAGNRVAAELLVLLVALVTIPAGLAARTIRKRCHELDLVSPPTTPRLLQGAFVLAGATLCVGACLPADGANQVRSAIMVVLAGGLGMVLVQVSIVAVVLAVPRDRGRTAGTLARSLIPVFAAAIVVVSCVAYPSMRAHERTLVRQDRILWNGSNQPPESPREAEATQRLLNQMQKALTEHPMPPGGER